MKPAIFNTEMVRAILDGRKTQTRRIASDTAELVYRCAKCTPSSPYQVGDIIYVRETFGVVYSSNEYDDDPRVYYKASPDPYDMHHDVKKWKPSIHMPKEYARLFLIVKDVRIERLNEISEEDAIAEGIERFKSGFKSYGKHFCENTICPPIESFSRLWESIYGIGSFDNRYVWVTEFERISKEEAMSETAT